MNRNTDGRWEDFLAGEKPLLDSARAADGVAGKTILITGAGGYIGSALAARVLASKPREAILLDHSEKALYELDRLLRGLKSAGAYRLTPGDVGDASLLAALLEEHRVDVIFHAAAYKHVPLMEAHPFAALHNNAILTWRLAKTAAERGVAQLLLVSTDKAASPRSILGASKRVAELAVLRWSGPARNYAAVRLVNVLGSTGSVVPLFLEQIMRGGPLTITHPGAARYFMTPEETVGLILLVAACAEAGTVYVPKLSKTVGIVELAKILLRQERGEEADSVRMEFTGLRPGDKITETLCSASESLGPAPHPGIATVNSARQSADRIDGAILQVAEAVERRNLGALLETVCRLVPDYEPSRSLCAPQETPHD